MKSRRQGIGTIILWWLTICCSVLLIAGCGGKKITLQEEERKERERKAMEEHAKRIAANKREVIAYKKYSNGVESFIPTDSIRVQNGELRFWRCTRNVVYPFAMIEYIVDYHNQRLRLETRGYDGGFNLIMHDRFNSKWYSFSELVRNPELKSGTLDEVAVVKEYLQSIGKWNI